MEADRGADAAAGEFYRLARRRLGIRDDGRAPRSRNQGSLRGVCTVREPFRGDAKTRLPPDAKRGGTPQCHRRQKRLEEEGLIRRYVGEIDPERLGYSVIAFVNVTVANGPYKQPRKFQQAIAAIDEIQECHTVTGEADYVLKVVATDLKAFSSFLMERLTRLDIINTTSMVSLETLKQTTALPIAEK